MLSLLQPPAEDIERRIVLEDGPEIYLFQSGWSIFSNFHSTPVTIDGQRYFNVEQYYQAEKAKFFGDHSRVIEILRCRSPRKCKELGKSVVGFDMNAWMPVAEEVMKRGVLEKFLQNAEARTHLKSTGHALLAEATMFDMFWATGLHIGDPANANVQAWPGLSKMGLILMDVRSKLP